MLAIEIAASSGSRGKPVGADPKAVLLGWADNGRLSHPGPIPG